MKYIKRAFQRKTASLLLALAGCGTPASLIPIPPSIGPGELEVLGNRQTNDPLANSEEFIDRIQPRTETIYPSQSGFTAEAGRVSAITSPDILRCGLSDWDSVKSEVLHIHYLVESNAYLGFSNLRRFRNHEIISLKLILTLGGAVQNNTDFRLWIHPLSQSFDENTLSRDNYPSGFWASSFGGYGHENPKTERAPGTEMTFDLTGMEYLGPHGENKRLIDNLESVHGFAFGPDFVKPADGGGHNYWEENYRTFYRIGEHRPRLVIWYREQ